jgi:hypothetical protein
MLPSDSAFPCCIPLALRSLLLMEVRRVLIGKTRHKKPAATKAAAPSWRHSR